MRIVVDLDNTLCTIREEHETYADVQPIEQTVKYIREKYEAGDYIIIHTARNMVTQNGDIEKVIANVGKITEDWLKEHNVPYHELVFGKPYGDVYIDDKALRPLEFVALNVFNSFTAAKLKTFFNLNANYTLRQIKKYFL